MLSNNDTDNAVDIVPNINVILKNLENSSKCERFWVD